MRTIEASLICKEKTSNNVARYAPPASTETQEEIGDNDGDASLAVTDCQLMEEVPWGTGLLGEDGSGVLTEQDRQLAAALVAVQYSQPALQDLHPHIAKVSEAVDVSPTVELIDVPLRLYQQHRVDGEVELRESDMVSTLQALRPLPPLKRASDSSWYHAKNIRNTAEAVSAVDVQDCEVEVNGPATQRASKRSLPHKKRISRRLRRPPAQATSHVTLQEESAVFICQLCGEFYGDDQVQFFHHLKEHYEPHDGTIIIEDTIEALHRESDSISMDKMDATLVVGTSQLPEALVELSLEGAVVDKSSLYDHHSKLTEFPEVTEIQDKTSLYPALDKPFYSCTLCTKTFRRQKQYELHAREAHSKMEEMSEFSDPEDLMEGIHVVVDADTEEFLQGVGEGAALLLQGGGPGPPPEPDQYILPHLTVDNGHVHQQHLSKQWYLKTSIEDVHSKGDRVLEEIVEGDEEGDEGGDMMDLVVGDTGTMSCPLCGTTLSSRKDYAAHAQHCQMLKEELLQQMMDSEVGVEEEEEEEEEEACEEEPCEEEPCEEVEDGSTAEEGDEEPEKTADKSSFEKDSKNLLNCNKCGRQFKHKNSMIYHMLSHNGTRPYPCKICNKSFFSVSALKVHSRLHSGDKPYKCNDCGRLFRQWGDLKYHFISIHSNQKQHQCEYCGKDFARKYSLIIHRRIHTGEKNYRCEFCSKTFRASSYLQNHRRIHTGEKPHACEICGKQFRMKGDMKRHLGTHAKEKPVFVYKNKERSSDTEEKLTSNPPAAKRSKVKHSVQTSLPVIPKEEMKIENQEETKDDSSGDAKCHSEAEGVQETLDIPTEQDDVRVSSAFPLETGPMYVWPLFIT